ncbi:MAG: FAD-dependent oxidoreductase [Rhodospirillales bacterium]
MQRIVVVGAGFAGLWAAIGAARLRAEAGCDDAVEILVLTRTPDHGIRVRFYESDLSPATVPLASLLPPVGVKFRVGEVTAIDPAERSVVFAPADAAAAGGPSVETIAFDRLVLAAGSALVRPAVAAAQPIFDVDTCAAAHALDRHLAGLAALPPSPGRFTAIVIGGGFTGIEVASELIGRLRRLARDAGSDTPARVILVDRGAIAATLGATPRPTILAALTAQGIEWREQVEIDRIYADSVVLAVPPRGSERLFCATLVATAGLRASRLTFDLSRDLDRLGRLPVDRHLRIIGHPACFAAGDVARALVDPTHTSLMSCQHARPQGRIAGHNVAADLLGRPLIDYRQEDYVTVLDLGSWGALYMQGWDRQIVAEGEAAKRTKQDINHRRIYPPTGGDPALLLAAAAPVIQAVPRPGGGG